MLALQRAARPAGGSAPEAAPAGSKPASSATNGARRAAHVRDERLVAVVAIRGLLIGSGGLVSGCEGAVGGRVHAVGRPFRSAQAGAVRVDVRTGRPASAHGRARAPSRHIGAISIIYVAPH